MSESNGSEEYPENWDKVQEGASAASSFLKIESGEDVDIRILSGPLAYSQLYVGEGDNREHFNLPFGTMIPGYKPRAQYAFEVLVLTGPQAGAHKLWSAGQKVAEQLAKVKAKWGDVRTPNITISKEGQFLKTKWTVTAGPASKMDPAHLEPALKLREMITYATKEDLEQLSSKPSSTKISKEQMKFISDLASKKDQSSSAIHKMIERKFEKKELDDLTAAEASSLIDTLKAL